MDRLTTVTAVTRRFHCGLGRGGVGCPERSAVRASIRPIVGVLLLSVALSAQAPVFDVVSIKRDMSEGNLSTLGFQRGGRFEAINNSVSRLIAFAYATGVDLPRSQILGVPAWMDTDRFDVRAIGAQTASQQDRITMVRAMLSERFHLVVHSETRDVPVYNLVRLRASGPLGEALHQSDIDCEAAARDGSVPPAPSPGQMPPCMKGFLDNQLMARGLTVGELATSMIARFVDRPVIDHTGLTGPYEWTIRWGGNAASDQSLPATIFSAVEEQLGLKLEPARGSVQVVVIDHVERPTED